MRSLSHANARDEIIERIGRLTPQNQRRWGQMEVSRPAVPSRRPTAHGVVQWLSFPSSNPITPQSFCHRRCLDVVFLPHLRPQHPP